MTEDLDVYFDVTYGMAVPGVYDGATSVAVIFDGPYLEQLGVAGTSPACIGKASVFPAGAVGKTLLIAGTTYRIRGREPLDDGATVLLRLED